MSDLPGAVKAGAEALSDIALDDVRVHLNSSRSAHIDTGAAAKGAPIHLAPTQERHLPHETWHIVQRRAGRVRPSTAHSGASVRDDATLEREADRLGLLATNADDGSTG